MSQHLLLLTVGPVQEFIAQARRTRDLWYGSHLLSELSRAAARAIAEAGGELIYPALRRGDVELQPCDQPLRNGHPPLSVANKILAVVVGDPEAVARAARTALVGRLTATAATVRQRCDGLLADDIGPYWDEQIATLPEFCAAWVPLDGDYPAARLRVEQAVAGRKALREFAPWQSRPGAPKSSLDGARESVLAEPNKRQPALVAKYRLGDGEQLDAVSLLKRAGGEPDQFVPLATVALGPYLRRARRLMPDELTALEQACQTAGFSRVRRPDLPCAQPFAMDAQVFYPGRWTRLFAELAHASAGTSRRSHAAAARNWGDANVRPLLRRLGEPSPYIACLVADGDHLGRALSALAEPGQHREFSERLGQFPGEARRIVEQEHQGILVYSGGDDVLAFLPVGTAVACAEALSQAFAGLMAEASAAAPPTLSVGIGIGHLLDGMSELLEFGRAAERLAKIERDSLAVLVDKRSGGRQTWAASWSAAPAERLAADRRLLAGPLSVKKVYELGALLRRLPQQPAADADAAWLRVLRQEAGRVLGRTYAGDQPGLTPAEVGLHLDDSYSLALAALGNWVNRLRVAMMLTAAGGNDHE